MNKEQYVSMIQEVGGLAYDMMEKFFLPEANKVPVKIIYLPTFCAGEGQTELRYEKDGDSGFDLRAAMNDAGGYQVAPQGTIAIPTGIKVAVPKGTELQVRTRSGSPLKRGFNVANSPGTVDSGYRGEIGVLVHNLSDEIVEIECGERIAQGVICPVYVADFIEVDELDETERGDGAFNSTGTG
jgi:dUTP pyrophosphatase